MILWWNGLDSILQVLYCIAIPSTLIVLLETIIALAGGGQDVDISDTSGLDLDADLASGDFDFNTDLDFDMSADANVSDLPSLRLFTVQGIVAFLCIASWTAIITYKTMPLGASLGIGAVLGVIAMFVLAKMMQMISRLSQNGTVNYQNAIGENARVYLTIPKAGQGMGKVNITIQGSLMECNAISRQESILTGALVKVVELENDVLVVEEVKEKQEDK